MGVQLPLACPQNNGGLVKTVHGFVSAGERLIQPKADQIAAARSRGTVVPLTGFDWSMQVCWVPPDMAASARRPHCGWFGGPSQAVVDSGRLKAFRDVGRRVLWPAFSAVVRV